MILVIAMMFGCPSHEHKREQAEDYGLDQADEKFKSKEDHADRRHQKGNDEKAIRDGPEKLSLSKYSDDIPHEGNEV